MTNRCPAPVWPSRCAVDHFERADTPACFVDWIDRLERQQGLLEGMR